MLAGAAELGDECSVVQCSSSGTGISAIGVGADDADAPLHWYMTVFPHACGVICGVRAISSGSVVVQVLFPFCCCWQAIVIVCAVLKQGRKHKKTK